MALELRQQVKLAQKLVMTHQLQQAIKLLQMNRMELTSALQAELERNPMLEEAVGIVENSNPDSLSAEEVQSNIETAVTAAVSGDDPAVVAQIDWEDYTNSFDTDVSDCVLIFVSL